MVLFAPGNGSRTPRHEEIYAAYEICFTIVDFLAAISFTIGSILFFYPAEENPAIWLFVIGSVFFALKPTIRLARELQFLRMGDVDDVAEKLSV